MKNNMPVCHARNLKVGLFGIGLDTYWPQFAGLKEERQVYQAQILDLRGFRRHAFTVRRKPLREPAQIESANKP